MELLSEKHAVIVSRGVGSKLSFALLRVNFLILKGIIHLKVERGFNLSIGIINL